MSEPGEVFPKAPLAGVAYEVRFPSLFYLPEVIGKFQIEIMDDFPEASQLFETKVPIEGGVPKFSAAASDRPTTSWQFKSESGKTTVLVKLDSLSVISEEYYSYDNPPGVGFKEVIRKIVTEFHKQVTINRFTRIGLRYTDRCPLHEKTNQYFTQYYKPIFDIEKNRIDDLIEGFLAIRKKKEKHNILFQCRIAKINGEYKYVMDFDAYAENVSFDNFLAITDELRDLDRSEFFSNITDDFKEYMRGH